MRPSSKKGPIASSEGKKLSDKPEKQVTMSQGAHRSSIRAIGASQGSLAGSQSLGNVTFNNNSSAMNNNRSFSKRKKSSSKTMKDLQQTPQRLEDRSRRSQSKPGAATGGSHKVKIPSSVKTAKDRRLAAAAAAVASSDKKVNIVLNTSMERSGKRASRSRSRERKSRSQSKKKKRDKSDKSRQIDLRKQIAEKEAQLAKMTKTADKLRKKIYTASQFGSGVPEDDHQIREAENFDPNNEPIINNIQVHTTVDPFIRDSFQQQQNSAGSQISKRERENFKSKSSSLRSTGHIAGLAAGSKSTQVGGGIRTQDMHNQLKNVGTQGQYQSTDQQYGTNFSGGVQPYKRSSPLRHPNYGTGTTGQRTDYMTIQNASSQRYSNNYQTRQDYSSQTRNYISSDLMDGQ